LQAYSRTNRILNSVKTFGNIVCFRDLEKNSNDSIALFGDKDASGIVILKSYSDYYNGYDNNGKHVLGYKELIDKLKKQKVSSLSSFSDEKEEQEFIRLYSGILKIKNILTSFDDYIGNEILTERQFQDYQSIYLELYDKYRKIEKADAENISSDIVFEIELIKQVEINIYYILHLVEKYHANNCKDKEVLTRINLAISSSPSLRSKKELIEEFVKRMNVESDIR
jgi:type I restriction enzyme R subunit